jgi:hypothetical protein
MRTLIALILLLMAGCGGGAVTEDEFHALRGRPVGDAVRRLGRPDEDDPLRMAWKGRVRKKDGSAYRKAEVGYNGESMRITFTSLTTD